MLWTCECQPQVLHFMHLKRKVIFTSQNETENFITTIFGGRGRGKFSDTCFWAKVCLYLQTDWSSRYVPENIYPIKGNSTLLHGMKTALWSNPRCILRKQDLIVWSWDAIAISKVFKVDVIFIYRKFKRKQKFPTLKTDSFSY